MQGVNAMELYLDNDKDNANSCPKINEDTTEIYSNVSQLQLLHA